MLNRNISWTPVPILMNIMPHEAISTTNLRNPSDQKYQKYIL
jgi:hypothetical protein